MFMKEYSPKKNTYDWDMMAYKYLRRGRECIIPEVNNKPTDSRQSDKKWRVLVIHSKSEIDLSIRS